ncbi:hypothetical protein ACSQ7W_11575 [Bacillus halotolerans]|uniref:hypothetical protein n=1 Tax=Bacillus halotolerans TaxID=260554 RepID=UPI00403F786B
MSENVGLSVEEAARSLEKVLGDTEVDVSQLKEALRVFMPSEICRVSAQEAGESLRKLFNEIDAGER